jgi:hypothetical protein
MAKVLLSVPHLRRQEFLRDIVEEDVRHGLSVVYSMRSFHIPYPVIIQCGLAPRQLAKPFKRVVNQLALCLGLNIEVYIHRTIDYRCDDGKTIGGLRGDIDAIR